MPRKKIKRFAQLALFDNVYDMKQPEHVIAVRQKLKNAPKVVLELACGKAEYTITLAQKNPRALHAAIDIQGERLYVGASKAKKEQLNNTLFIRGFIDQLLEYIPVKSIDELWLTFPDPFPRGKQAKKRLTATYFLNLYKQILKKGGILHLKTDSELLYKFSISTFTNDGWKILKKYPNIDRKLWKPKTLTIKTYFENIHRAKGTTIKYIRARVES